MASKAALPPFVISFGSEPYFLDRDLVRARAWTDRSIVQVDGEEVNEAELVSLCETRGYEDKDRVVIVDDAQKIKADKTLKAYVAGKDSADSSVVLVAIIRGEKLPEIWSQAAKKGQLYEHKKLTTWENNNQVVKWTQAEATRMGLTLEKGIAELIFQLTGGDLYTIASELRKLLLLVGKAGKVGTSQVRLVLAPRPSAEPFQVAEAVVAKDEKKAMDLLSVVYRTMGDEAHVPLCFSLLKQVEKLLLARSMLDRKSPEDEIALALALGMNLWRCQTHFLPNVRKHTMRGLVSSLGRLRALDIEVKGPARSKRTRVELVVLSLTRSLGDAHGRSD